MRMIVACQGESDFDDNESTRSGWLTEIGKKQVFKMAERLSELVGASPLVVISGSRRGRQAEEIFKKIERFHGVSFIRDPSCSIDDSHPDRTAPKLHDLVLKEPFDTLVVVGHPEQVTEFVRDLATRMKLPPFSGLPQKLESGQAYLFDSQLCEGRIV